MTNIVREFKHFNEFVHKGVKFLAMEQRGTGDFFIYSIAGTQDKMEFWGAWSTVQAFKARRDNKKANTQFGELTPVA